MTLAGSIIRKSCSWPGNQRPGNPTCSSSRFSLKILASWIDDDFFTVTGENFYFYYTIRKALIFNKRFVSQPWQEVLRAFLLIQTLVMKLAGSRREILPLMFWHDCSFIWIACKKGPTSTVSCLPFLLQIPTFNTVSLTVTVKSRHLFAYPRGLMLCIAF